MSPSLAPSDRDRFAAESRPDAVTLADILRALKERWRWIAGPALVAFLGSLVFVTVVTPRYTGETRVILESRETFFTRPGGERVQEPAPQIDEQAVASQVQVVMSRDLAREAIKQLGLVGNAEFDPLVGGLGALKRLFVLLGFSANPFDRPPEDRVLEEYYDHLLVYPVGKSRILAIDFRSKDPELAAKAANTIAELYLNNQEAAKKDTARSASTWLGTTIETLRGRVAAAESKVEEFRSRQGLFASSTLTTAGTTIIQQQLSDLNNQLATARTAQADAQAKARLIREMIKSGRTFDIPDVANNELIRRLIEQRINLRAQLALEQRTLLPEHPRIKELNAQVNDLESQIRGAAERTVRTLENDARIAGSRVETLQAAIEDQKKAVAQANEAEVELRALEREAKAQREQLETYLARFREASARDAENAVPPDARIVSRAIVPQTPSFPKKVPIVVLATLAALILSSGAIASRELLASPEPQPREPGDEFATGERWPADGEPADAAALRFEPQEGRAEPLPEAAAADDAVLPSGEPKRSGQRFDELIGRIRRLAGLGPSPSEPPPAVVDAASTVPPSLSPPDPEPLHLRPTLADAPAIEPAPATPPRQASVPPIRDRMAEAVAAALGSPTAKAPSPLAFDPAPLIARLERSTPHGRGRRVLVIGCERPAAVDALALALGRAVPGSAIRVALAPPSESAGFTDLVSGEASFADVIERDPGSRLQLVAAGRRPAATLAEDWNAVEIAIGALDQTYDWLVMSLPDNSAGLLEGLAAGFDAVVIASDADALDPKLVDLYVEAREGGAPDVIVARETVRERALDLAAV